MKKTLSIFLTTVLLIANSCTGAFDDPGTMEFYGLGNPTARDPENMILLLLSSIKNKNDYDKVKFIHDWIADKVDYDYNSYYSGSIPDQSYINVLSTGLSVCEGYANVFKELCDRVNIPCEKIHGYGRGLSTSPFLPEEKYSSNHAWNMVYVDGKWNLVDVTWDDRDDGTVIYDYFFVKPEHMIYDHYPEDNAHQLLDNPLSYYEFSQLPYVWMRYFDAILEMNPAPKKVYTITSKTYSFDFKTNEGWEMMWNIQTEGGTSINQYGTKLTDIGDNRYRANVTFPDTGRYYLIIFAKQGTGGSYSSIARFGVEVN